MTGQREELLMPLVPPWAAYIIDREYGEALEQRGRVLAGDERTAEAGRQLLIAVRQMREAARQQWEAYQSAGEVDAADAVDDGEVRPATAHRVTPKEAAPMLGVGVRQVVTMCRNGKLDAVFVGGRWLIDEVSLAVEVECRRAA